jgi:hypothetical protein
MSPRRVAVAVVLVSLLVAESAAALDRPIAAAKLVLKRAPTRDTLAFVSRDPGFLFPPIGGADDPATGTPGGLSVELFSGTGETALLPAPGGLGKPGWLVASGPTSQFRFQNALAPGGVSVIRLALLKQGRVLKVTSRIVGLALAGPQGSVGIRITTGTRRSCALFDPATIKRDEAGRFVARNAVAAAIADCSNASLGGAPPTTTTTTSTTLPGCSVDPFAPACVGVCPSGEQCVGGFGAGLGIECGCIPDDATPCLESGYPACGGACTGGRVCQAFHLLPGEGPEITSCACVDPGNTCDDPAGTCFEIGVCAPGQVCEVVAQPTSACGCGSP